MVSAQLDRVDRAAAAPRRIASRYYQLKSVHAAVGAHLHGIQERDSKACSCGAPKEIVCHAFFECRQ